MKKIKQRFYSCKRATGLRILMLLIKLGEKFNKKDIDKE